MNMSNVPKNKTTIISLEFKPNPYGDPRKNTMKGGKKASSLSTCVCLNSFSKAAQRRKKT